MAEKRYNLVQILSLTKRDNCRDCGLPTCMAFAAQVTQGRRALRDCPHVARTPDEPAAPATADAESREGAERLDAIREARAKLCALGLPAIRARLGLPEDGDRIRARCLGRIFEVDATGELHSECHRNGWVHLALLQHLLVGTGRPLTGTWVPFPELPGGREWAPFFTRRCEQGLAQLAAVDAELLCDLFDLFGGPPPPHLAGDELRTADRSTLLEPLPGVALLFRCWLPDGDFDADLSLLYDRASIDNADPGTIYLVTQGVVEMFRRIALRHGARLG